MKKCRTCLKELEYTNFYSNGYQPNGRKKYKPDCKSCSNEIRMNNFMDKLEVILKKKNKGLSCERCSYSKNFAALCFHHKDHTKKESKLSDRKTASSARIEKEISECELLCHNCHMEEHYTYLNL